MNDASENLMTSSKWLKGLVAQKWLQFVIALSKSLGSMATDILLVPIWHLVKIMLKVPSKHKSCTLYFGPPVVGYVPVWSCSNSILV